MPIRISLSFGTLSLSQVEEVEEISKSITDIDADEKSIQLHKISRWRMKNIHNTQSLLRKISCAYHINSNQREFSFFHLEKINIHHKEMTFYIIDWLIVFMLFHFNSIEFFLLVTHKRKISRMTNFLLSWFICALSIHSSWYHFEASQDFALSRIFKYFYSINYHS